MNLQGTEREEEKGSLSLQYKGKQINVKGMMIRKSPFVNSQVTNDADQNHERMKLVQKYQSISLKIH